MKSSNKFSVYGKYVDIFNNEIYPATVVVKDGKIYSIKKEIPKEIDTDLLIEGLSGAFVVDSVNVEEEHYIIPGFIDSHVHIESSMLIPAEFAKLAVVHGTVATVSDPHEIANVCGIKGVEFMIKNGNTVNFKFNFGAPSCVPATGFETAGDTLNSQQVTKLLKKKEIKYLSEMMNFPGVLFDDAEVMAKIAAAKDVEKPIDGHAPGLRGEAAKKYIDAGISTDHECFTKEEALEKLSYGMKILIREGSAAKNFEALIDLLNDYPDKIMFCSDDKHPDSLLEEGHINELCRRAVEKGIDIFKVLRAACINPVEHYKLDVGLLRIGDAADFIIVEDLKNFEVYRTYINGELMAEGGCSNIVTKRIQRPVNKFNCDFITSDQLKIKQSDYPNEGGLIPVIEALEGQLITNKLLLEPKVINGNLVGDTEKDILKIVVVNRYQNAPVSVAFIRNFNLKQGAIASSVAHDSHNIVAIGVDDDSITEAINLIIKEKGGICYVCPKEDKKDKTKFDYKVLGLPVAGLMSKEHGGYVASYYQIISNAVKEFLGCTLDAPFMTLSFMALLVIPHLKISDKGLFDGDKFTFLNND